MAEYPKGFPQLKTRRQKAENKFRLSDEHSLAPFEMFMSMFSASTETLQ
jgi:hypothetical protein